MIALYDFIPKHCPNCGVPTGLDRRPTLEERKHHIRPAGDYLHGASHTCDCGLSYQFAQSDTLLEASRKDGDLAQYV